MAGAYFSMYLLGCRDGYVLGRVVYRVYPGYREGVYRVLPRLFTLLTLLFTLLTPFYVSFDAVYVL